MHGVSQFGRRLRLSRLAAGLSLRQLAAAIDHAVSAQAIGQYERGRMLPGSNIALKLAAALAVPLAYLVSPLQLRLEAVEFRRQSALPARQRALVEAAVLEHLDRYLQVEGLLDQLDLPWRSPPGAPYAVADPADAELAARRLREAWHLGQGPLAKLTEELEQRGIRVLMLDIPLSVDGLSCQVLQSDNAPIPVVVASTLKSSERQRFVMAHELGHMVLAVTNPALLEAACDRFAGAFLMPAEAVRAYFGARRHAFGYEEICDIARLFGISGMTVLDRLVDLKVITAATRRRVSRMLKPPLAAWPTSEVGERPRRFQRLVLRALAEGALTEAKAVELLQVTTSELARLINGPPDAPA
jgi:Zn-dependent peptidase ImmA (M78 family)/transcriptional regulator with XRE-family HTH domain